MNSDMIYPEPCPIFHTPRAFLIRNNILSTEHNKNKRARISKSPGSKHGHEIHRENFFTPSPIQEFNQSKPESPLGNYQISYYPTSKLNPELEEQCKIFELYRNISRLDFRKAKSKTPMKQASKARKLHFHGETKKFQNFLAFSSKRPVCKNCKLFKCICNVKDKALISEPQKTLRSTTKFSNKLRFANSTLYGKQKIIKIHPNRFPALKITRRAKPISLDIDLLQRDLLITPLLK